MIDAAMGEILVTVEKLKWTIQHGEGALRSESRPRNFLMMYKNNEVRWEPLGVVAACVSWKYVDKSSLSIRIFATGLRRTTNNYPAIPSIISSPLSFPLYFLAQLLL